MISRYCHAIGWETAGTTKLLEGHPAKGCEEALTHMIESLEMVNKRHPTNRAQVTLVVSDVGREQLLHLLLPGCLLF